MAFTVNINVKHFWKILIGCLFIFQIYEKPAGAQIIFEAPQSERIANYRIDIELDTERKILTAKAEAQWRNFSGDTVDELYFHTYMNAFSNTESTFMSSSGRTNSADYTEEDFGYIRIIRMQVKNGENLSQKMRFVSPNDGNNLDRTVMKVPLSEPVLPDDSVVLEIDFTVKLPRIFARTGYADDFFMVGQWFPKFGVYENGAWNCRQFHANSEFYADFGVYEINITLPKDFTVGATGVLTQVSEPAEGMHTLSYRAEDVIDFAWTASPRYTLLESEHKGVKIHLLLQPEHLKMSDRYLSSLKIAMDYFEQALGPYPYPKITLVDPPLSGVNAGGMEYPMLITSMSSIFFPKGLRFPELVTIHEFGHQYFMGILATDEASQAWLDEGMNSYFESLIMDEAYGQYTSVADFWGLKFGNAEYQRMSYAGSDMKKLATVNRPADTYPFGGYSVMSYNKPAVFLNALKAILGAEIMQEIFRKYYETYRFKHPTTQDFIALVKAEASACKNNPYSESLDHFFEQFLNSTAVCDFAVRKVSRYKAPSDGGYYGKKPVYRQKSASQEYITTVYFEQKGDFSIPAEVKMVFDNGDTIRRIWNGKGKIKTYTFRGTAKLVSAEIDPERKLYFDIDFNNNSYSEENDTSGLNKYLSKLLFWLQNLMQFTTFI